MYVCMYVCMHVRACTCMCVLVGMQLRGSCKVITVVIVTVHFPHFHLTRFPLLEFQLQNSLEWTDVLCYGCMYR